MAQSNPSIRTCILCERAPSETGNHECRFHSGKASFLFSTGADFRNQELAYRDIYLWSCCGRRVPSTMESSGSREAPPERAGISPCATAQRHLLASRVAVIASGALIDQIRSALPVFAAHGLDVEPYDDETWRARSIAESPDAVVLLDAGQADGAFVEHIREFTDNGIPLLVFTDPDRGDGTELQAMRLTDFTVGSLLMAIKQALRSRYIPDAPWVPDIFFSYTRRDGAIAESYIEEFSNNVLCWFDKNVLLPGVRWASEIFSAVDKSKYFFLMVTPNTPEPTYCWIELERALNAGKTIFAVAHGDSQSKFLQAVRMAESDFSRQNLTWSFAGLNYTVSVRVARKARSKLVLFDSRPASAEFTVELRARREIHDLIRAVVASSDESFRESYRLSEAMFALRSP
ncbi:MAG TPA: toll/interleukin-1 receptor domain-containing protein [Caulobacteraceae bacterium]